MMKNLFVWMGLYAWVLMVACANKNGHAPQNNPAEANTSVEINKPNTDYQPAFAGQTRVKAIKTNTAFEVLLLADGIGRPWAVVPLPDGRLLITEKSGYMELRDMDGKLLTKVSGFPAVDDRGQGGMLDVVPDPDFVNNKILYWAFSEQNGSGNLTAIAKGNLSADEKTIENVSVIFRATPSLSSNLHFGCRLLFGNDGFLYASVGERSIMEGRKQAQWLSAGLGKIFRLTKDGKAAPGNPFAATANAMPEIWSYGHRNPQSMALHPATGDLWEAEFGPRGGDELNLIKPGKNYGWPVITYGIEYGGGKVGDGITQKDGMEQPVYYWDPVISPSGMCFYAGDAIAEWKNNLFIACLSGLHVARLVIENNRVVGEERLLTDQTERFRDIAYADGKLYVVTDSGKLLLVKKK